MILVLQQKADEHPSYLESKIRAKINGILEKEGV